KLNVSHKARLSEHANCNVDDRIFNIGKVASHCSKQIISSISIASSSGSDTSQSVRFNIFKPAALERLVIDRFGGQAELLGKRCKGKGMIWPKEVPRH